MQTTRLGRRARLTKASRRAIVGGYALLAAAGLAGGAHAMDSCTGQYSATLLQPLPVPTVVALDLRDSSDVNLGLARAFSDGMRAAGQMVGGAATVKLTLLYQVIGQGGGAPQGSQGGGPGGGQSGGQGQPGGPDSGWSDWSGDNAPWLQGGQSAALPDIPRYDMFHPQAAVQSALLLLRAELRDAQSNTINWVATLQCTLQGGDNQRLAYELGTVIGGALGKRVARVPL